MSNLQGTDFWLDWNGDLILTPSGSVQQARLVSCVRPERISLPMMMRQAFIKGLGYRV